jgi:hypothetical protein
MINHFNFTVLTDHDWLQRHGWHNGCICHPETHSRWTYFVFLLQAKHSTQVLGRNACLADTLLLHKPGLLLLVVLQELEEIACIFQPNSPSLTALNQAGTQVKINIRN